MEAGGGFVNFQVFIEHFGSQHEGAQVFLRYDAHLGVDQPGVGANAVDAQVEAPGNLWEGLAGVNEQGDFLLVVGEGNPTVAQILVSLGASPGQVDQLGGKQKLRVILAFGEFVQRIDQGLIKKHM